MTNIATRSIEEFLYDNRKEEGGGSAWSAPLIAYVTLDATYEGILEAMATSPQAEPYMLITIDRGVVRSVKGYPSLVETVDAFEEWVDNVTAVIDPSVRGNFRCMIVHAQTVFGLLVNNPPEDGSIFDRTRRSFLMHVSHQMDMLPGFGYDPDDFPKALTPEAQKLLSSYQPNIGVMRTFDQFEIGIEEDDVNECR